VDAEAVRIGGYYWDRLYYGDPIYSYMSILRLKEGYISNTQYRALEDPINTMLCSPSDVVMYQSLRFVFYMPCLDETCVNDRYCRGNQCERILRAMDDVI
jgi:hypothetical protein